MASLFSTVLKMSVYASATAVIVMLARLFLRKKPKIFSYVLWSAVLFSLVCPIGIRIPIKVKKETPVLQSVMYTQQVGDSQPVTEYEEIAYEPEEKQISTMTVLAASWLTSIAAVFAYSIYTNIILKQKLRTAVKISGNVFESDRISTAFVTDIIKPKIYVPTGLSNEHLSMILLHEQTHIRRCDHIVKLIAYCAAAVHWFNPIIWLSYALMCADMESSCDEAVVRGKTKSETADYCEALLCVNDIGVSIKPTFSENNAKKRILNIISFKKCTKTTAAVLAFVCAAVILLCAVRPTLNVQKSASVPEMIDFYCEPQYIPEGFEAQSAYQNLNCYDIIYCFGEKYISYKQQTMSVASEYELNGFDDDEVNGMNAYVRSDGNGENRLYWTDERYFYTLIGDSDIIELRKMAESVNAVWQHENIWLTGQTNGGYMITGCTETANVLFIPAEVDGKNIVGIGEDAFSNREGKYDELESVSIGFGIEKLCSGAFDGCGMLSDVMLPETLKYIGENAFRGCETLREIYIPEGVEYIAESAFDGCEDITICCKPDSYAQKFADEMGIPVQLDGEITYLNCHPLQIEPEGDHAVVKVCWKYYSGEVVIPSEFDGLPVRRIESRAFEGCRDVTNVVIPDSVESIGEYAFRDSGVEDVIVPQ